MDETEARIAVNNRKLSLEQSKVKLIKTALELSNFLWLDNNKPVEQQRLKLIKNGNHCIKLTSKTEISVILCVALRNIAFQIFSISIFDKIF